MSNPLIWLILSLPCRSKKSIMKLSANNIVMINFRNKMSKPPFFFFQIECKNWALKSLKHVEMLLGLNFTDITGPSANFKQCPTCCFKCSCSLCKSQLQKQWREHRHKKNNSLVCCSLTGDGDTIDESPFLISGNENVELALNVDGIPKQQDMIWLFHVCARF